MLLYKTLIKRGGNNMPKTSEATLKAIKKYNANSKYIQLKFTRNQLLEYERIIKYCDNNKLSYQGYIKELIKKDLDEKGI